MTLNANTLANRYLNNLEKEKRLDGFKNFFEDKKTGLPDNTDFDCVLRPKIDMENSQTQSAQCSSAEEDSDFRRYLAKNNSLKLTEQSSSAVAIPFLLLKKKDGGHRLCMDYRQLNSCLECDMYP
jgi:hypothetical protein